MKKLISIGLPCFNEELNVIPVYQALKKTISKIKKYDFEFIYVDNGSTDKTRDKIKILAQKDKRVVGVFLSRNFGPEASGQAALDHVSGDVFITMAADLQDPPDLIHKFIEKWENGYNVVFGIYRKSEDSLFMTTIRKLFYLVYKKISNINVSVNTTGFSLIDSNVINAMKKLPEKYRFGRGLRAWVGFRTSYVNYNKIPRRYGTSSYNIFDYFQHAERGIFGFSYLLLDIIVYLGFLLVLLAFIFIIGYLFTVFAFGNPIKGSITIFVSVIFFGGVQLLATSIIGKYIQVIVEETKARPVYIVEETINVNEKNKEIIK